MTVLCVVHPVLRPSEPPRAPQWPVTCEACRSALRRDLSGLPDAVASLPREPGTGHGPRVSGTPEPRLPVRLLVVDLTLRANQGSLRPWSHRFDDEDQVGPLSVATVLDSWVRDWIGTREQREHLPPANVVSLVGWLLNRLDWACDEHPAVDEFASDLRDMVRAVRLAAGTTRLVHHLPVKCPSCDLYDLKRDDGADYVECRNCHRLWTEDEYRRLVVVLAAEVA